MARASIQYPFVPKSSAHLEPGHFWSIPLDDGRFACGRVIRICSDSTRSFLAALLDWSGDAPPTSETIEGCQTVELGYVYVKTIQECGGEVLGWRPLEADGIDIWSFPGPFSSWGYMFIKLIAEERFRGGK